MVKICKKCVVKYAIDMRFFASSGLNYGENKTGVTQRHVTDVKRLKIPFSLCDTLLPWSFEQYCNHATVVSLLR